MKVSKIWCICVSVNVNVLSLRMKLSMMHTIWGGGRFVLSRCLYSSLKLITAAMPSSCGMFVSRDVTSTLTKRSFGGRGGSSSIRLTKHDGRLICDK